jgi:hypothetical protein
MSKNQAEAEHDPLLDKLVAEFGAVHQPSDCIAAVRRMAGIFGRIVYHERDWSALDGEGSSPCGRLEPDAYTIQDVNDVASKLRALVAIDESKLALNTQGIVRRLAPDIYALRERGYTLARVAETLTGFGVEVTEALLRSWLDSPPEPPRL